MVRAVPLTVDALADLPEDCRRCTFWELGGPRPCDRATTGAQAEVEAMRKQAWVTTQALESGAPGRVVRVDGELAGWAVFAPAAAFPARAFATSPAVTPRALVIAGFHVELRHRGRGIGRVLVQSAIKEAIHRELKWVEVVGDRSWREGTCLVPVSWWLHEGFEVHTPHPRHPLLRLTTSRTVRWTEAIGHAVEEVRDLLPRRLGAPVPTPETFSGTRS